MRIEWREYAVTCPMCGSVFQLQHYPGRPGKTDDRFENCYPPDPEEFRGECECGFEPDYEESKQLLN